MSPFICAFHYHSERERERGLLPFAPSIITLSLPPMNDLRDSQRPLELFMYWSRYWDIRNMGFSIHDGVVHANDGVSCALNMMKDDATNLANLERVNQPLFDHFVSGWKDLYDTQHAWFWAREYDRHGRFTDRTPMQYMNYCLHLYDRLRRGQNRGFIMLGIREDETRIRKEDLRTRIERFLGQGQGQGQGTVRIVISGERQPMPPNPKQYAQRRVFRTKEYANRNEAFLRQIFVQFNVEGNPVNHGSNVVWGGRFANPGVEFALL